MAHPPTYGDGTVAAVGDRVLIEHGRTRAVVESVVFTEGDLATYDEASAFADEVALGRGLPQDRAMPFAMLLSSPFGRVAWQFGDDNDPMRFVRRGALGPGRDGEGRDVDDWW